MQRYRRGQVEWALWQLFSRSGPDTPIELAFRNRIKRLIEIDKTVECPDQLPNAFGDGLWGGSGYDASFSEIDPLCCFIAVELLDSGLNQKENVQLLRHIRYQLEQHYAKIIRDPPTGRENI